MNIARILIVIGMLAWGGLARVTASESSRLRRPIALELGRDESMLFVANQRSGTIVLVDTETQTAAAEFAVGKTLSGLRTAGERTLVAIDFETHELILLAIDRRRIEVRQRLSVSPYPVGLCVTADGERCLVTSLWSRRASVVELPSPGRDRARLAAEIDLPFAPRCALLADGDTRAIVADAFGGNLAVLDLATDTVRHIRTIPGHNVRGIALAADGERLVVAHQMLNELAHTVQNDVHWGLLMSNDLRWLRTAAVLSPDADLFTRAHMQPLGHAGSATGDPAGLAVAVDGTVLVSLGGVNEIAIGREDDFGLQRLAVGRRPTAIAVNRAATRAYVANTFDDSISVVDIPGRGILQEIRLGADRELTLADRGELLFYDASLSHDGWMSCHSCHTDGHTNGLLNDNFSDGSFGAPKRVLSLLGKGDTAPFAWNGEAEALSDQIRKSIEQTMQSDRPAADDHVLALAEFVAGLRPPPPIDAARGVKDALAVDRGQQLFNRLKCGGCHRPPEYTRPGKFAVGLEDKQGNAEFNPPSLRGVSQRGPYFHDNRAKTLGDVFREFSHQLDAPLSEEQLQSLLAFLRSL